jgi:hypothetical protein
MKLVYRASTHVPLHLQRVDYRPPRTAIRNADNHAGCVQ